MPGLVCPETGSVSGVDLSTCGAKVALSQKRLRIFETGIFNRMLGL